MRSLLPLALLFAALGHSNARAQYAAFGATLLPDGLTATGTDEITLRPEFLQLTIQIEGRASELPQAVGELKRRVEAAQTKLKELTVTEGSVVIGAPKLGGAQSTAEQQQMQAMMAQYGGGQRGKKMLENTKSVSVTQTLTARWPLPGEDGLQRLTETKKLTAKIREADVASAKEQQPVSPAQEELSVEMAAMMEQLSYGETQTKTKAGEPSFQFVALVTEKQYRDSLSIAFDKAKRRILVLSQATKTDVADPLPINSSITQQTQLNEYSGLVAQPLEEAANSGSFELIGDNPNEAKCTVKVTAIGKHKSED